MHRLDLNLCSHLKELKSLTDYRLLENVRVRRAGYAFRQVYERFLYRYKMLASVTWPHWKGGVPCEGVQEILREQEISQDEYAFGKTKIFIRNPKLVSVWLGCVH